MLFKLYILFIEYSPEGTFKPCNPVSTIAYNAITTTNFHNFFLNFKDGKLKTSKILEYKPSPIYFPNPCTKLFSLWLPSSQPTMYFPIGFCGSESKGEEEKLMDNVFRKRKPC